MFKTYALGGSIAAPPDPHGVMSFVEKEAPPHGADRLRGPRDRRDDQARQDASSHPMVVRVHRSEPSTPCRRSGDVPRVRWLLLARQRANRHHGPSHQARNSTHGSSATPQPLGYRRHRRSTPHYPTRPSPPTSTRRRSRTDVPRSPGTTPSATSGRSALCRGTRRSRRGSTESSSTPSRAGSSVRWTARGTTRSTRSREVDQRATIEVDVAVK